jgi:hypothetical protein
MCSRVSGSKSYVGDLRFSGSTQEDRHLNGLKTRGQTRIAARCAVGAGFMPALGRIGTTWAGMKPAPTDALSNSPEESGRLSAGSVANLHRCRAPISLFSRALRHFHLSGLWKLTGKMPVLLSRCGPDCETQNFANGKEASLSRYLCGMLPQYPGWGDVNTQAIDQSDRREGIHVH